MNMKLNISQIDHTWSTCEYKYRVFVDGEKTFERHNYILKTLKQWFGDATYFWNNMYLAGKK